MPPFSLNPPDRIVAVRPRSRCSGDIAARQKKYDDAIAHFDRAVRLEDAMTYTEPPDWHAPVRHWLGAALLEAGRPAEAEVVYWDDLRTQSRQWLGACRTAPGARRARPQGRGTRRLRCG